MVWQDLYYSIGYFLSKRIRNVMLLIYDLKTVVLTTTQFYNQLIQQAKLVVDP